jgi:hypothetical protein
VGYPTRRRRTRGLSSTLGTAIGTVLVTALLDLSWPVRIGLLALVLVVGLGYIGWAHRAEIMADARAEQAASPPAGSPPAPGPGPQDGGPVSGGPASGDAG